MESVTVESFNIWIWINKRTLNEQRRISPRLVQANAGKQGAIQENQQGFKDVLENDRAGDGPAPDNRQASVGHVQAARAQWTEPEPLMLALDRGTRREGLKRDAGQPRWMAVRILRNSKMESTFEYLAH